MRILMVVAYFVPEVASAAHVYKDLAEALIKKGNEVHVITSCPRRFNLIEGDKNTDFPLDEVVNDISIHRCKHRACRDNVAMRGLEHFLLPRHYFKRYRRLGMKFDVCLVYIPPLPLFRFGSKIKEFDGTPTILNYQDFHPQELVDVGIVRNRLAIWMMERLERKSYRMADFITVLSEGGVDYVVERGADRTRVRHIYNGIGVPDSRTWSKVDFKKKEGIEGSFLVSYAGILSPFQGIDSILEAARRMKDMNGLLFYIVGDGMIRDDLQRRISDERMSNVRLLPLQNRDEYSNIIASTDVSIVALDARMTAPCLPGKIASLMLAGRPIVAVVPQNSETARVVKEANCGVVVEPGDPEGLCKAIIELKEESPTRRLLGDNGRRFFERYLNVKHIAESYIEVFSAVAKTRIGK